MQEKDIISSGLLELYAMGAASEKEANQVEEWIKLYPGVLEELNSIELALENYAQSNAISPSTTLKEKIFSSIQNENRIDQTKVIDLNISKNNASRKIIAVWKFAAAASVIFLLSSLYFTYFYYNQFKQTKAVLENTQIELAYQKQSVDAMKNDMGIVQSKYSKPVELSGMDAAPEAAAKIFWMKNTGEVYIDPSNLPDAPEGKQYQLWAIVNGKPVDAGLIVTTEKGSKYRIQKMKTFGAAEAFAVTLEKKGGSKSPTLDKMFVMGKI